MHRYEMSGALSGLQRVRGMTLNDAHIFVRPDQIKEELKRVVNLTLEVYKDFGLENYSFRLSYRDPEDTKSTMLMMRCGKSTRYVKRSYG